MYIPPRLRLGVLLLLYWARIGIKVNLMGMEISMILGTPQPQRCWFEP